MIRVKNYVRLVRGGNVSIPAKALSENRSEYSNKSTSLIGNSTQRLTTQSIKKGDNKFINRFDKNRDGKVELSEFKATEQRFNHFDKNKDGYISADEAPTGPPKNASK
nr:EF-hand domain-containing protein [Pseudoalteromonas sp. Z9A4]